MKSTVRLSIASIFVVAFYCGLLPCLAIWMDYCHGLVWRAPPWSEEVGSVFALAGVVWAIWRLCKNAIARGDIASVVLSGWVCAAGLGFVLHSPCLVGMSALIGLASVLHERWGEAICLLTRFAAAAGRWARRLPSWVVLIVVAGSALASAPMLTVQPPANHASVPGILVQIRCKLGMADKWRNDFNAHIRPAIDDVIARGGNFTGFELIEPALPWQNFDFVLLYTGGSFSGLDQPRLFPHYQALLQREGPARALSVVSEMGSCEDQVTVTIVHVTQSK